MPWTQERSDTDPYTVRIRSVYGPYMQEFRMPGFPFFMGGIHAARAPLVRILGLGLGLGFGFHALPGPPLGKDPLAGPHQRSGCSCSSPPYRRGYPTSRKQIQTRAHIRIRIRVRIRVRIYTGPYIYGSVSSPPSVDPQSDSIAHRAPPREAISPVRYGSVYGPYTVRIRVRI